jgi:hypothetical protein
MKQVDDLVTHPAPCHDTHSDPYSGKGNGRATRNFLEPTYCPQGATFERCIGQVSRSHTKFYGVTVNSAGIFPRVDVFQNSSQETLKAPFGRGCHIVASTGGPSVKTLH